MRGSFVGPTVNDLYALLGTLREHGLGDNVVLIFEPAVDNWVEVGYVIYGAGEVKLYNE